MSAGKSVRMKKSLLFSLCVAIAMCGNLNAIEANVVGYMTREIRPGVNIIMSPFDREDAGIPPPEIGTLLNGALEGDKLRSPDFSASAELVDGKLHWVENGEVVDSKRMPDSGKVIVFIRSQDKTTSIILTGQYNVDPNGAISIPNYGLSVQDVVRRVATAEHPPALSLVDRLSYSTIRIERHLAPGNVRYGTGLFFMLKVNGAPKIPIILTNWHVAEGAGKTVLVFTSKFWGLPAPRIQRIEIPSDNGSTGWIRHPDTNVDLAFMFMWPIEDIAKREYGIELFYCPYDSSQIPTKDEFKNIRQLDDVAMIGYPDTIIDLVNNQPIFRMGTIATSPSKDFNGKREFVIDMPCFGGSSGSPVLLANKRSSDPDGENSNVLTKMDKKPKLLGVMYAGPQHQISGDIYQAKTNGVTKVANHMVFSAMPNNMGVVIHSSRILELEAYIRRLIKQVKKQHSHYRCGNKIH